MRSSDLAKSVIPERNRHALCTEIEGELVVLNGWLRAVALNSSGAAIWNQIDGRSTLHQITVKLSEAFDADYDTVAFDVATVVDQLSQAGLVGGRSSHTSGMLAVNRAPTVGDTVKDLRLLDLVGNSAELPFSDGSDVLVIYWNPHCGYCMSIATRLVSAADALKGQGIQTAFVALGDAESNRATAQALGITAPLFLLAPGSNPFPGVGTPSAYLLNSSSVIKNAAWGNRSVPQLAEHLAGLRGDPTDKDDPHIKYLLDNDGLCPATVDTSQQLWTSSRVYRIGQHHVGMRFDSDETAIFFDRLFHHQTVKDERAGHSYSVRLIAGDLHEPRSPRPLNLLVRGGGSTLSSRSSSRIVRALLSDLDQRIRTEDPFPHHLRVRAQPILHKGGVALLPINLGAIESKLRPMLVRSGLAVADLSRVDIDLETTEVIIPEPRIDFDALVLSDVDHLTKSTSREYLPVSPGRYPLTHWGVVFPADNAVSALTPAQAAAATISSVVEVPDPIEMLNLLGELFQRIRGFGYWYHSERELAAAIDSALNCHS